MASTSKTNMFTKARSLTTTERRNPVVDESKIDALLNKYPSATVEEPAPTQPSPTVAQAPTVITDREKYSPSFFITSSGARVQEVPVDSIDLNPYNARQIYVPERVAELARSIAANGQEIPGIATREGGRFILVAGHYRLRAIKQLGLKSMLLLVHEKLSDRELYSMSYRENAERESQTALDNALSWDALLKAGIYKNETEIAEATGQSLPNINRTMSALRLPREILELIKLDPSKFGSTIIYALVQYEAIAGVAAATKMANGVKEDLISRKDIEEATAKLKAGNTRKHKETSRQYPIQINGHKSGVLKEWDSNKVLLEIQLPNVEQRKELVELLKDKFKITA